jgi:NADPH-dependent glutamate synthase beta subunit-like oxidoreductase/CO/xanthine dehydrogenase FAD-binding subunit
MKCFDHINAKTINQVVKLMKSYKGKLKLIAGGTDLLGILKDRIFSGYPEVILNIKTIPGLDYIKEDSEGLKIGALTKLADIEESYIVNKHFKLLAEAAKAVATPQIRNMATIGGNLCQDVRCWYYRYPFHVGGRILCDLKGGKGCYALTEENQYHSIFGASKVNTPPCSTNCPGTLDIPSFLSKVREGALNEAAEILLNSNPMPSITGRVCPHSCEPECNRNDFDESVSIRCIERFIGDHILKNADEIVKPPLTETGKSVAIVGSGPAGLSAAYFLRMLGHHVTVFDRMEEPGGMLAYGIPTYRLPKDIVKHLIKSFKNTGIVFKTKVDVGKDVTFEDLKGEFSSIFLASGAWGQQRIGVAGEELTQSGLEFLSNMNLRAQGVAVKKVLVIGGGNVAVDVGITALRLGAEEVTLACVESRKEMPALKWEIEQAVEEGIKLMPSWGPYRVLESGGKVVGMDLVRCTSAFNREGCFAPTYDHTVNKRVEADQIIMAVGQTADLSFIDPKWSLRVKQGWIVVDSVTQGTNMPGVFAGGEATSGPATVIDAIASGKRAAIAVDLYLNGSKTGSKDEGKKSKKAAETFLKFNSEYLRKISRIKTRKLPISRRSIYVEDIPGLDLEEIEIEANRCFNCGCVAVASSDIGVALLALNAKLKIAGPNGLRKIPIDKFFSSLRTVAVRENMVTEILIPKPRIGSKQTFQKFRLRETVDFAVVSVASVITIEGGVCKNPRVALGAVAPIPIRATKVEQLIEGKAIDDTAATEAAEAIVADTVPLSKNAYKIEIAKILLKRAILSQSDAKEINPVDLKISI